MTDNEQTTEEQIDENKLIAQRREKLTGLREKGNAFPNDFRRDALAAELHASFDSHSAEDLDQEQVRVKVAGRLMAKRVMGKASFAQLQDMSGRIQLFLQRDSLPEGVYNDGFKSGMWAILLAPKVLCLKLKPVSFQLSLIRLYC